MAVLAHVNPWRTCVALGRIIGQDMASKVRAQIQQSYNWAYGAIRALQRMLPFILRGLEMKGIDEKRLPFLRHFTSYIADATEELLTLGAHLEIAAFSDAANYLVRAREDLEATIAAVVSGSAESATSHLRLAIAEVGHAKSRLDDQSAVRYRFWFLNPWRNYPRRIAKSLPRPRSSKLDH